jgi:Holliday junction resolvase RusA-like endonuclease
MNQKFLDLEITIPPFANQETRSAGGIFYTPAEKKIYMKTVSRLLSEFKGYFEGCKWLRLKVVYVCERPAKAPIGIPPGVWATQTEFRKGTRPDADNYLKPLQDSLSNHTIEKTVNKAGHVTKLIRGAGIIDDDSHITSLIVDKIYATPGGKPRTEIKITELTMFYTR